MMAIDVYKRQIQDMREQLPECEGYSDSRGLFSARKAIMQYAQLKGLPNVSMDGIYTGNGVSELINPVSYTHLDVYKRQPSPCAACTISGSAIATDTRIDERCSHERN